MRNFISTFLVLSSLLFCQNGFDKIEFTDIRKGQLYIAGFSLEYDRDIYIEAIGSGFEDMEFNSKDIHGDPSGLFAYPWIIDANSRKLVWRMTRDNSEYVSSGDLYEFKDKVSLPQGEYEVYYYGTKLQFYKYKSWWNLGRVLKDILVEDENTNDGNNRWKLIIDGFDSSESESSVRKEISAMLDKAVVRIEADRPHMFRKRSIKVTRRVNAEIYAIGEGSSKDRFDYGWIKELNSSRKVWEMKKGRGVNAGGALKNVMYRDKIILEPGEYEVAYMTDDSHHLHNWNSNLPFDPLFYGLTVFVSDDQKDFVEEINTDSDKIIAEITRIGDESRERQSFTIDRPTRVKVSVIGEGSDGTMYDYGYITDSRGKKIWQVNYYMTSWAGGAKKNRLASEVLVLPPGDYKIYYRSDGSHSWEGWNDRPPENPENYGIIVYFLENADKDEVVINQPEKDSNILVDLTGLENDEFQTEEFELGDRSKIHIIALGEGTNGKMYDYGWIESIEERKRVWEMDFELTVPAGGSRKNRAVDEVITLPAGRYKVYFITDDSHAYGDWNVKPPENSQNWGIQIILKR